MMIIFTVIALIILAVFAICRFLGPRAQFWLFSSGEEKIGLSKNKLYNANGYIVHSGSEDIFLGSTGSFKRFDSVDRNAHEGEIMYGQTALATPPWTTDESIPPQPLRPAPLPLAIKVKNKQSVNKQESLEPNSVSAPLKSTPRPVPRKQMSAPSTCQIPLINPPEKGLQKIVKDVQQTTSTNPFLNGFVSLESIKSNFFSTTVTNENERATKSAFVSKNPFKKSTSGGDNSFFDFNPKTIKSIMEETTDDGYLGDNDDEKEDDAADPLKQLEERIQKLEASGKQRRKSSGGGTSPRFSPKLLKTSPVAESSGDVSTLNSSANEKFVDSSLTDESVAKSYRKHIRTRSFSENEASDNQTYGEDFGDQISPIIIAPPSASSTNPFLNGKRLLKTPSESYLEQFSMMRVNNNNSSASSMGSAKATTQLCKHPSLNKILQTSQPLFENSESSQSLSSIKRALSSESISSESSVVMSTLEKSTPPVTGLLCIALQYDKNSTTEEGCELLCTVLEAKNLIIPPDADPDFVDTFVRVYLVPDESDAMQTKVFKGSRHPSYQEMFGFFITKQNIKRSLWFHLYHTNATCTTLIGETEMKLTDFRKPITTWLQLSDSRNNCTNCGDLMFSLSYLPTAERLTVVVVKTRNLRPENDENENRHDILSDLQNVFVKVRLTVMNLTSSNEERIRKAIPIGHVIIGSRTDGKGLLHWHQMITSLRKPIAMFHPLRRSVKCKDNDEVKNVLDSLNF